MKQLKLKTPNNQTKKGFTIIEVVLVLAIAGLIFLMVFIALPALQRNQRDTQRKNDLSRTLTAVQSYQSNNRGQLPTDWGSFVNSYLKLDGDQYKDPDGSSYVLWEYTIAAGKPTYRTNSVGNSVIFLYKNAKCDGENIVAGDGSNRIAFAMFLEGGGLACENN